MKEPHFNGPEYQADLDFGRLTKQHDRVKSLMLDGQWRTLFEIEQVTGDPASSVSAQLRHLRKERFGGFLVERRKRGDRKAGLFEYRVTGGANDKASEIQQDVAVPAARDH